MTVDVIDDPVLGPVVRKTPRDEAHRHRLEREAEMLAAAQHPGVVELVGDDAGAVLTRDAGEHTLDSAPRPGLARLAGILAAVADTLGDLHAMGIVHGRIEPSHVILGDDGRPVLCGFGGAAYTGAIALPSAPLPPDLTDPAHEPDGPLDPAVDVFGVGATLRLLLSDDGADIEPIPERRFTLARLRRPWSGFERRALLNLADQATAHDPLLRPTARSLAAAIRDAVPGAHVAPVGRDDADPMSRLRPAPGAAEPRRGVGTAVAAASGLALLFVGLSALAGASRPAPLGPPAPASAADPAPASSASPAPEAVTHGDTCPAVDAPILADVDGDGCADPVTIGDDGTVGAGGLRFAVAEPGDSIAVADWACDGGVPTPAVLRPSTGAVYVFDRWATAGDDATATRVGTAAGATTLRAGGGACPSLEAVAEDGNPVEVVP